MSSRVQVILSDEEKARFQSEARRQGMSLSAWLRLAAIERLAARPATKLSEPSSLRAFFATCDRREEGQEPDWDQHLEVIQGSRGRGASSN
jgi:hypothetical protein